MKDMKGYKKDFHWNKSSKRKTKAKWTSELVMKEIESLRSPRPSLLWLGLFSGFPCVWRNTTKVRGRLKGLLKQPEHRAKQDAWLIPLQS